MACISSFPKAIIFDLDGTLVSSDLNFKRIREEADCPEDLDILQYLADLNLPEQRRVQGIIRAHEMRDVESCQTMEDANQVLQVLRERNVRTGIVTRNSQAVTKMKLDRTGLQVEQVLTRECAPPKPAPDALLSLAEGWSLSPQECIYVGDYLYDVQAAHRAHMHAGLFVSKAWPDYANQAHFTFTHFNEFFDKLESYWRQRLI